jgi:hypothetical protein
MSARGLIESFPPRQIRFATKPSAHRFHDITRIGKNLYVTRFAQSFESNGCRDDLRLLVCRATEILPDRAPESFVTEQSNCRRAARLLPVAQTRSIAKDCYLLE